MAHCTLREGAIMKVGQEVMCYNVHTGRGTMRRVIRISPSSRIVTVERLDWKSKEALFYRNGENYRNEYSSEIISS